MRTFEKYGNKYYGVTHAEADDLKIRGGCAKCAFGKKVSGEYNPRCGSTPCDGEAFIVEATPEWDVIFVTKRLTS